MNSQMRRELARQPFEQKIRRVAELINLAQSLKVQRAAERADWAKADAILARVPEVAPQADDER